MEVLWLSKESHKVYKKNDNGFAPLPGKLKKLFIWELSFRVIENLPKYPIGSGHRFWALSPA